MLSHLLIAIVCSWFLLSKGSIPEPTAFGTIECKKWPSFELQDYNPSSHATYLQTYGLADIQPASDVTIVGLYFADSDLSQQAIMLQERMGYSLQSQHKLAVHNIAINFYAPKACALIDCEDEWSNGLFKKTKTKDCSTYTGGCAPGDERLQVDNWQGRLYNVTNMPILQDSYWIDAWERFGGGEGDIFIYDSEGRLFTTYCTEANSKFMPLCTNVYKGGSVLTEESYKDVKNSALSAGRSDSAARCGEFDDEYYSGYRDQYYYYYYGDEVDFDDDSNDDDYGKDEGEESTSTDSAAAKEDDDYDDDDDFSYKHSVFHLGYRNNLKNKVKGNTKNKGAIPIAAYASVLAVSVLLVSVVVIYVRWNKAKAMLVMASRAHSGTTKFSRLATNESDQSNFRDMLREDESSYGSL